MQSIERQTDGTIIFNYLPIKVGNYEVKLKKNLSESTLKINFDIIPADNLNDDTNWSDYLIYSYGYGLIHGLCEQPCEIFLITRYKSVHNLVVLIEGPTKVDCTCAIIQNGHYKIIYCPKQEGEYLISFKIGNKILFDSRFSVRIESNVKIKDVEEHTESVVTLQSVLIEEPDVIEKETLCSLTLKLPHTNPFDLSSFMKTPSSLDVDCDCLGEDNFNYKISFEPKENGKQTISVLEQEMHINGSPFEYTIGETSCGGPHKVKLLGSRFLYSEIDNPLYLNIYTRESGYGKLVVLIHGLSRVNLNLINQKDGIHQVKLVCQEAGEYVMSILFNDEHILDSPFKIYINSPLEDGHKVTAHDIITDNLIVNNEYKFILNLNRAHGTVDSFLIDPYGAKTFIECENLSENRYEFNFIPKTNGFHWLFTRFNEILMPPSPYRLCVGNCKSNPGLIQLNNLQSEGKTDEEFTFLINTLNSGMGRLDFIVEGPDKVDIDYEETQEGYLITLVTFEPGDYLITIKHVGIHIASSPLKVKFRGSSRIEETMRNECNRNGVPIIYSLIKQRTLFQIQTKEKSLSSAHMQLNRLMQRSDSSKVKLRGTGLLKAFRNQKAQFNVDTRDAGTNMLFVGVYGVKTKCDELIVKHLGNSQYLVTYCIKGKGNSNVLVVKYGDTHVSGSPFRIEVI